MVIMKRSIILSLIVALLPVVLRAQALVNPFTFVIPSYDSTSSAWLPSMPIDDVEGRGWLRSSGDGHLEWSDGTRARFVGAGLIGSACFPDSLGAIAMAGHLRKLGVNMVRFNNFDYHNNDGASTLAPGTRSDTLSPAQMKKLDWLLYQLKRNGIHAHFVLKSRNGPRREDGVPGWDSTYNNGQYITYISAPYQRMQQRYLTKLFTHVNPYTGRRYADDPVIALLTINDQNSLYDRWVGDRLHQAANVLSYGHARLLDTLYTDFLRRRHGSTAALRSAYREGIATAGPNRIKNPGFEEFTDNWTLQVGEGAQASPVIVQGADVAAGEGKNSLRIAVRKVNGTESRIYLEQRGFPSRRDGIYQMTFKGKTDSAAGRVLRVASNFGLDTTVTLTTSWQSFSVVFRATLTDSLATYLRFYAGKVMGDVFLDGIGIRETGRDGLAANESLESYSIYRGKFREVPKMSLRRMYDQVDFYDSLARSYYRTMRDHLRSLGVHAMIAGTNSNNSTASADTWIQSEFEFTSETAQWDYTGTRAGSPGGDSTWVMRNYSVLKSKDYKIPEFAQNAIMGKPFIAESYLHIFPNAHRSESMLFFPAYAALHDWDGAYFHCYAERSSEIADRRRVFQGDYSSFIADPSICALMPQVSLMLRNGWIAPAERTLKIQHDLNELRSLPLTYYGTNANTFRTDGALNNVINLVGGVRIDSFAAARHYTANDYYVTIPNDDNIASDTRQIMLDLTKGILQLNAPRVQGASGALGNASAIRTDGLSVSWIDGAAHITYLWTPLDTLPLDSTRRSLLTISTRALNSGAIWQFGDSSIGKNWGTAPTQMESVKLGINFTTAADSVAIHPLDSTGQPTGRTIAGTRATNGSWRVTLDLAEEKTPWFGVEQIFDTATIENPLSVPAAGEGSVLIGEIQPNPGTGRSSVRIVVPPGGAAVSATVVDMLGRTVATVPEHRAVAGQSMLALELRDLAAGSYICLINVGETTVARHLVVRR